MSTQYMQPPIMHFGGPSQYYGGESSYPNGYASQPPVAPGINGKSFAFRKRYERVDWRKIASLDLDNVSRTLDFNALQENIMNITFCNIEAELDTRFVDPNFVKLFKLAQLTIEYLLHSQEFLTMKLTALEDKLKTAHEDHEKTKKTLEDLNRELTEVKKESHKRKKLLIAQQQLIHAGSGSYNKCPYCPKAFLNSSFLTSHMNRRHAEYFGSNISPASEQRELSQLSPNRELEAELQEIKERLKMTENQLRAEKRARRAEQRRGSDVEERTRQEVAQMEEETPVVRVHGEDKTDIEKTKEMFMKEMKEMAAKQQASEQIIAEMKYGRRSNLGELQDDVDNEKELLQRQREEVAMLREQLQAQMNKVEDMVSSKLEKQESKWNQKVHKLKQQHAGDLRELSDALERTTADLAAAKRGTGQSSRDRAKSEEVEELIRRSREQEIMLKSQETTVKDLIRPQSSAAAAAEPDFRAKSLTKAETPVKMLSMEPSDEEDGTGTGTGSFSGTRTPYSTLGTSGELTLQTTQFLDQLRKNPTLKIMRDQLAEVLEENLEKIGITRGTRGIPDEVLQSKVEHLNNRRQTLIQKYPVFPDFRKQFDQYATQQAKEKLKALKKSPLIAPARPPSVRPASGSQQTISTSGFGSSGHLTNPSAGSSPKREAPSPQHRPSPAQPQTRFIQSSPPKPAPRSQSPKARIASPGRAESPLHKTGSSAEYTSTQWDSDEDEEEDSDDQPAFKQVRPVVVSPARSVPSGQSINLNASARTMPRSQPQQVKTIASKPLKSKSADEDENDDDWDDSLSDMEIGPGKPAVNRSSGRPTSVPLPKGTNVAELSSGRPTSVPIPKGTNVAELSRSIELQLSGRKVGGKPVGGVDTMGPAADTKKKVPVGDILDFNSDSDWDVSPVEEEENKPAQSPTANCIDPDLPLHNALADLGLCSLLEVISRTNNKNPDLLVHNATAEQGLYCLRLDSTYKKGTPASRGSHASTSFSTNTYGSSQWGGSAKTASSVNPGGTRGTSNRSSFVSVTDVSDDEDLDLENI